MLRETFEAMGRAAFDGYPDLLHLKSDAEVATVEPAAAFDNVDLVTGVVVTRIVTDAAGGPSRTSRRRSTASRRRSRPTCSR